MRTLGLIGGMSWESTALYYKLINQGVAGRLGGLHLAPLLLHSIDFAPVAHAQHVGDWDSAAQVLRDSARRLEAGGAQALVLCTNTMHKLAPVLEEASSLPLLHIADSVGEAARRAGHGRVGLLATGFTMREPFLKERLAQRYGLEVLVPPEDTQQSLHRVIYEELCRGVLLEDSRTLYRRAIAALGQRGAQAVILGCTEIGLLIQAADSELPLLDSTVLHAQAAVDFALAGEAA